MTFSAGQKISVLLLLGCIMIWSTSWNDWSYFSSVENRAKDEIRINTTINADTVPNNLRGEDTKSKNNSDDMKQIIEDQAADIQTLKQIIEDQAADIRTLKLQQQQHQDLHEEFATESNKKLQPDQDLHEEFATESNKKLQPEEKVDINDDNNSSSGSSNPVEPTSSCPIPVLDPNNFTSDRDFYKAVHQSAYPACAVGSWTYRPDLRLVLSREHLQCLDLERQGNCHDPDVWKHTNDTAKRSRHDSLMKQAVLNSPGILNASDPWVWTSDLEPYKVLPIDNKDEYISRVRKLFLPNPVRIFFVGDSLTRQWERAMKCELEHVVGIPKERVDWMIRDLPMHDEWSFDLLSKRYELPFQNATERDYVVFNFGHHVGKKLGNDWPSEYVRRLSTSFSMNFGRIPDHHIYFRTTSVRHFLAGQGDWDTESSKAGGIRPNPEVQWWVYGGNSPEQPEQNLLAFDTFLGQGETEEDINLSYQATIDYVASKIKNYNVTTPTVTTKPTKLTEYDHKDWEELPNDIQEAAELLGYKRQTWKFNTVLTSFQNGTRHFRILDTSPMMLSRSDATFDGSHFCLPGPMEFWSRMLYYQMEREIQTSPVRRQQL